MLRQPMPRQLRDRETGRVKNIHVIDRRLVRVHIQQWEEVLASCQTVRREYGSYRSRDWRIKQLQASEPEVSRSASSALDFSRKLLLNNFSDIDVSNFIGWLQYTIWGSLEEEMRRYNVAIMELKKTPPNPNTEQLVPLDIAGIFASMRSLNTHLPIGYLKPEPLPRRPLNPSR